MDWYGICKVASKSLIFSWLVLKWMLLILESWHACLCLWPVLMCHVPRSFHQTPPRPCSLPEFLSLEGVLGSPNFPVFTFSLDYSISVSLGAYIFQILVWNKIRFNSHPSSEAGMCWGTGGWLEHGGSLGGSIPLFSVTRWWIFPSGFLIIMLNWFSVLK